jgi:hypothetical protein
MVDLDNVSIFLESLRMVNIERRESRQDFCETIIEIHNG